LAGDLERPVHLDCPRVVQLVARLLRCGLVDRGRLGGERQRLVAGEKADTPARRQKQRDGDGGQRATIR
jgi:hypothetical protein